ASPAMAQDDGWSPWTEAKEEEAEEAAPEGADESSKSADPEPESEPTDKSAESFVEGHPEFAIIATDETLPAEPIELRKPKKKRRGPSPWMMGYGGLMGGYTGGVVAHLIDDKKGAAPGTLIGMGLGVGTAGLVTMLNKSDKMGANEAILLSSTSGIGTWTGYEVARAFLPDDALLLDDRMHAAGLLGTYAGAGLGLALSRKAPSWKKTLNHDLAWAIGWQAGAGAARMATDDRRWNAGASLMGGAAMLGTSIALDAAGAPAPKATLAAVSLTHGAWLGLWAPLLVEKNPDLSAFWGGARLGLGAGYLMSRLLAPAVAPDGRSLALQSVGIVAGNGLGAGIPLMLGASLKDDPRLVVAPMLASGLVGQIAGGLISPHYRLSKDDTALLAVMETWTAYNAIGWSLVGWHSTSSPSVTAGAALTAASAGTLLATGLAPVIDVSPAESIMLAAGGGWGTWYGAWSSELAGLEPEQGWLVSLGAGNAALIGTAALVAGPVQADWVDVGIINGLGAAGGAGGALVGIVASPDLEAAAIGSLVGSTVGLGTGIALALAAPKASDTLPSLGKKFDLPVDPHLQVSPWTDEEGAPGVYMEIKLTERAR
ncbi:MAG: hypothetical protein HN348_16215, partial [Proteobacteria bacterium]|nr:hypothetical protein [Pseudomonadota bacterium]